MEALDAPFDEPATLEVPGCASLAEAGNPEQAVGETGVSVSSIGSVRGFQPQIHSGALSIDVQ